jgi:hypothetical protein
VILNPNWVLSGRLSFAKPHTVDLRRPTPDSKTPNAPPFEALPSGETCSIGSL